MIQNEPVGQLDEEFVAEHAQSGAKFICSGRAWKVIQIIGRKVMVEPIEDIESSIPAWEGELIPVDFHVAQDVGTLRAYVKNHLNAPDLVGTLEETYHVNRAAAEELIRLVFEHCKGHILPTDKTLLCETYKDFIILHTCAGSLVNATLAKYLGGKLTNELGVTVNIKTDPYRIMLQTVAKPQMIEKMLQGSEDIDTLWLDMERSSLFKHRFLQVARRFGILAKNAPIERINLNKIVKIYEHSPAYKETVRELSVDKLDIETTKKFLEQLWNGDVTIVHETGLSLFGEMGLVEQFSEVMRPRLPEKEIFSAFTRRLMKTRMRLVCLNCASYSVVQTVDEVAEQPECPKCGSRLMGISHPMRHHVATLLVKKHAGKPLTEEEKKELKTLERTADLTIVYGKRAVICLAGHGIGPQTAARILSNLHATQEALCKDILKAEKQFIKTKPYWN
ncbi:MAG: hypothetical protein HY832_00300 [Candidatus Aenigmarchaeota archaeon]|nr:hypothetical protein [Candidatus Aenigmarchaeota archaeon]